MIDAKFIREAAVLPIAAVLLGLAYNSSSPLGVRLSGAAISSHDANVDEKALPAIPTETPDPALHNETITAAIVSGGNDGIPVEPPHKPPATMTWPEVKAMLVRHEGILIDGRDSLAYEAGHIPGAISLPLNLVTEKISALTTKYPMNTPLVIYCASPQCAISRTEANLLSEKFGYSNVREMPGGYAEWLAAQSNGTNAAGGSP